MKDARSPLGLSGEVESGRSEKYPKLLVEECISVFKEENDLVLSEEEAIAVLDGLAGLFLAFSEAHGSLWTLKRPEGTMRKIL